MYIYCSTAAHGRTHTHARVHAHPNAHKYTYLSVLKLNAVKSQTMQNTTTNLVCVLKVFKDDGYAKVECQK